MKKIIFILASMVTFATTAFAEIGSPGIDLVYTPITPCRVLDTRPSQGGSGPIAAAGTKTFFIWGATSYAVQGGSPTNCGITAGSNVAAVAMNFTVVTPAAGGFITAYPFGAPLPVAATVNFQVGDIARGDFTIAKVAQTGLTNHLSIYSTSLTDVVGDVVGYYSMPVATGLQCTTLTETVSVAAGFNSFKNNTGASACATGYAPVSAYCSAAGASNIYLTGSGVGAIGFCSWVSFATSAVNVTQGTNCCRIPGR